MPSWSARRQLLYLLIPLVLAVGVFAFIYSRYVYTAPTCSDGVQNQGETGVDCGGPCSLVCQGQALEPIVLWAKSFQVTGNVWNAVAYVQNPNVNSSAKHQTYEFDLYDQSNGKIASRTGSIDIPKNKTFAVFEGGITTNGRVVKRTEFTFTTGDSSQVAPTSWFIDSTTEPDIVISNNPIENASTAPKITGQITNPTLGTVGPVELVALIFDGQQNVLGASRTVVDSLTKG